MFCGALVIRIKTSAVAFHFACLVILFVNPSRFPSSLFEKKVPHNQAVIVSYRYLIQWYYTVYVYYVKRGTRARLRRFFSSTIKYKKMWEFVGIASVTAVTEMCNLWCGVNELCAPFTKFTILWTDTRLSWKNNIIVVHTSNTSYYAWNLSRVYLLYWRSDGIVTCNLL